MAAKGSAQWKVDMRTGTGTFSAGETISGGYTYKFRFEDATVTLRPVDGSPTITKIDLVTVGGVPGIDEPISVEKAVAAKAGCPVSRALAGVPEITLDASLAPEGGATK